MADGQLNRRAERTIAALLTTATVQETAATAHVPERTIYRWLREDEQFKSAYRAAKWAIVEQSITAVQQATARAVQALVEIMTDRDAPANARVAAARTIMELSLRGVEMERFEVRLSALEAKRGLIHVNGTTP
jgi:hypothetical protein